MNTIYVTPTYKCPDTILQQGRIYTVDSINSESVWIKEKFGIDIPFEYLIQVFPGDSNNNSYATLGIK